MYLEALAVATSSEEVRRAAAAVHDTTALPIKFPHNTQKNFKQQCPRGRPMTAYRKPVPSHGVTSESLTAVIHWQWPGVWMPTAPEEHSCRSDPCSRYDTVSKPRCGCGPPGKPLPGG